MDAPSRSGTGLAPGTRMGRYLVVDKIGEGGAGAVYAAFDAKLDRKVALKLLERGAGGPMRTVDPRWPQLVREARMLAKLSEPEVVTVFDVGESGGVAYLAMEYIEGGDLAAWIAQHRGPEATEPRGLRDALDLMLQAGAGLAAAHGAHLVHGDFKPANVLVDARGRAKVSDFGIARLRAAADGASQDTLDTHQSRHGDTGREAGEGGPTDTTGPGPGAHWIGTPAFMAPEQFDGVPPSEGTDVYAYFTALFQAVYGVLPWRTRSVLELAARKAHQPPDRPPGVAVPRWLDALLDRGLDPDPRRRPPSMQAALAALRSGMRRRRTGLIVAAGSVAVLGGLSPLAFGGWGSSQGSLCETEGFGWSAHRTDVRERFESVGHRAPDQAWSRVDARMTSLQDAWAQAWSRACAAHSSPTIQQQSLRCLERQRRQAQAQVDAWTSGGGEPEGAGGVELVDRASRAAAALAEPDDCLDVQALAQGVQLPEDPELAQAVTRARAEIDTAVALMRTGNADAALPAAREAFAAAEATAFAPVQSEAALVLARVQERLGDLEAATETMEHAYFEAVGAEAHDAAAQAATRLVWMVGVRLERHDEGLLWAQHAQVALSKTQGRRDQLMANIGGLHERKGDYALAESSFEAALKATPEDALDDRGIVHQRLGDLLRTQGKTDRALAHYDQVVALWTEALGAAHPNVAIARSSRASGLSRAGRNEEAVAEYRAALDELEGSLGPEHPTVSAALVNLGITLKNLGRWEEAEAVMRRSVAIDAELFGPEHLKTADRREALGRLLTRRGQGAAALVEHEVASKAYSEHLDPGHPDRILNMLNRGDALRQIGRLDEAQDAYGAGYRAALEFRGPGDPLRPDTAAYYGRSLVELGKYTAAKAILEPAVGELAAMDGYEDVEAIAGWALARAMVQTGGDRAAAVALARASRQGLEGWAEERAALDAWVAAHE